ncbi:dTDP-4-dehydrorhamnose 3,5-epimerase family protein [Paraburkholderia largidicola]|uniref:dTDP-4-dehydrorhamnose 3,5-epimerase n=1 Tax=Paraburkholderia largidicola TaxID=3014751 RepID=A0A7I8BNU3_9BURK|nr:dTDP-4-dehydrorhamnose 3,5-epimerase family protein [Paraburkholderia sp. PGU16]BCF90135.1 dTDP-4-dehydrorhamnose 3,5-epimerase [Paraburkholderia sp. PGU16]
MSTNELTQLPIEGAYVAQSKPHADSRGSFMRLFCAHDFGDAHGTRDIVQINWSHTVTAGTVRGMHFQAGENADAKWVRCMEGRVWDVIVDLRPASSTFMRWHAVELAPDNARAVFIPEGCAHGFQTLESDSRLLYLHTQFYAPAAERGVAHDDPQLAIAWPRAVTMMSERDRSLPGVAQYLSDLR